jgi:uncharacterized protein
MLDFIKDITLAVLGYLRADWYILLIGILIAVIITVYVDTNKMKKFFKRKAKISIPGAVAFGALTPLCACGTTAVMLSMFVSSMPWGTVMAFMISSPLTSPSEYMFETAFFGSKFATGLLITSIVLGISAGIVAHLLEKRTKFFDNQFRLGGGDPEGAGDSECSCSSEEAVLEIKKPLLNNSKLLGPRNYKYKLKAIEKKVSFIEKYKVKKFFKELYNTGFKKILLYFVIFIAVGRIVEMIIPKSVIIGLFSGNKFYSVPLAATIGLPLYLTDSSAIPLLKSFINSGAGEGAVLAFLIAGKATGIPVIAGMSTILKKRAMVFYLGFIYFGAILAGYLYQFIANIKF